MRIMKQFYATNHGDHGAKLHKPATTDQAKELLCPAFVWSDWCDTGVDDDVKWNQPIQLSCSLTMPGLALQVRVLCGFPREGKMVLLRPDPQEIVQENRDIGTANRTKQFRSAACTNKASK